LRLEEQQLAFLKSRRGTSNDQSIQRFSDDSRVTIAASSLAAKQGCVQTPGTECFSVIQPFECGSGAMSCECLVGEIVKDRWPPAMSGQNKDDEQNCSEWPPETSDRMPSKTSTAGTDDAATTEAASPPEVSVFPCSSAA
jgi:hypothetical protein